MKPQTASAAIPMADVDALISEHPGVVATPDGDDRFYFYDPEGVTKPEARFPFATLMTTDAQDQVSNLSRPGVYRLNLGLSKATFLSMFDETPERPGASGVIAGDYPFAEFDTLFPHPVYGHMYWVAILNPTVENFETNVRSLIAEAYTLAANNYKTQ